MTSRAFAARARAVLLGTIALVSTAHAQSVEQLRLIMAEVQVATVRAQVLLSLAADFENYRDFKPGAQQPKAVETMLDQLVAWGGALKALRAGQITVAA